MRGCANSAPDGAWIFTSPRGALRQGCRSHWRRRLRREGVYSSPRRQGGHVDVGHLAKRWSARWDYRRRRGQRVVCTTEAGRAVVVLVPQRTAGRWGGNVGNLTADAWLDERPTPVLMSVHPIAVLDAAFVFDQNSVRKLGELSEHTQACNPHPRETKPRCWALYRQAPALRSHRTASINIALHVQGDCV